MTPTTPHIHIGKIIVSSVMPRKFICINIPHLISPQLRQINSYSSKEIIVEF